MRFVRRGLFFGLAVWCIPFLFSLALYAVRKHVPALYESIMPVIGAGVTTIFAVLYFTRVRRNFMRNGIVLGFVWLGMCIAIDLIVLPWFPGKFSIGQYFADIGVAYLMIPIITFGIALAAAGHVDVRQRLIKLDRTTLVPEFVPQL